MNYTMALFSLLAAFIPMFTYLVVIWKLDRYDREPIWLVSLNFLWGAVGAIVFGFLGSLLLMKNLSVFGYSAVNSDTINAIYIAPLIEEIAKGAFLLFVTSPLKDFDNMTDGVVYGASIGLGFGMTENFLYFSNATSDLGALLTLIAVRSIFSAVMHACSTATFGAAIGYAKFHTKGVKRWLVPTGFIAAVFIHFFWNFSVTKGNSFTMGAIFIGFSVMVIVVLLQTSLKAERRVITRELNEEVDLGNIPANHMNYLPYTKKRNAKGWLDKSIDHVRYIKIATTLAFRKQQSMNCPENKKAFYLQEVEDARGEIAHLLKNEPI